MHRFLSTLLHQLMKTKKLLGLLLIITLLCPFAIRAQHNSTSKNVTLKAENSPKETRKFILHHLNDAHSFTVWHEMGWTFPLPVILWDNGLQIFSSSRFDNAQGIAEANGNYYKIVHSKIYKTDAEGTIDFEENGHPANVKPFDISITKNVFSIFIAGFLLFFIFYW